MKEFALNKALEHFKINVEEFIEVYDKFNYAPHSVEEFIFEGLSFVSESMPERIIDYIKENNLGIDTSTLDDYILAREEWNALDEIICNINYGYDYGYDDDQEVLDKMRLQQDELYELIKNIPNEVFKIRETIKQLTL